MQFELGALKTAGIYKLMAPTITRRPVAWITSRDAQGRLDAHAASEQPGLAGRTQRGGRYDRTPGLLRLARLGLDDWRSGRR